MRWLFALLAPLGACTEAANRYTTHERQVEARLEGDLELHYAWIDAHTLLVAAPIHAANGRAEFSAARLSALTRANGPRLWLTVSLWRFGAAAEALPLGSDGLAISAETRRGRIRSLPPSKLLEAVEDSAARPLLSAMCGAGPLPALAGGQSLQLVAALPTDAANGDLSDLRVALPSGEAALARTRVAAVPWDEFRSQPARERFEALLAAAPVAAASGKEAAEEDDGEPEK